MVRMEHCSHATLKRRHPGRPLLPHRRFHPRHGSDEQQRPGTHLGGLLCACCMRRCRCPCRWRRHGHSTLSRLSTSHLPLGGRSEPERGLASAVFIRAGEADWRPRPPERDRGHLTGARTVRSTSALHPVPADAHVPEYEDEESQQDHRAQCAPAQPARRCGRSLTGRGGHASHCLRRQAGSHSFAADSEARLCRSADVRAPTQRSGGNVDQPERENWVSRATGVKPSRR